ncbi:MAG: SAM-dependent methyltransferase [Kordiimonas sp.]|nr:SAM-dependent methyltransferase [Kordiimonas sp.]
MRQTTPAPTGNNPTNHELQVFDRRVLRLHRDRSACHYPQYNFLFQEGAERLVDRLEVVTRPFSTILELGCHGGELEPCCLPKMEPVADRLWLKTDLSMKLLRQIEGYRLQADEEFLPVHDGSLDLIISNLSLHWINDLPGTLIQINRALRPDGLFLASLMGGDTLSELRQAMMQAEIALLDGASPHVSPFADLRDMGGLLQRAGFALPVVEADTITVTYENAYVLMKELQAMGESNTLLKRAKGLTSRRLLTTTVEAYHDLFARSDGRIPVTFQMMFLTAWAPHESQPKPLAPGSAKARLADALGVKEHGEDD